MERTEKDFRTRWANEKENYDSQKTKYYPTVRVIECIEKQTNIW